MAEVVVLVGEFHLHERLSEDLLEIGNLSFCHLRMMPNAENPWLVLIPQLNDIKEWHQLNEGDQVQLTREISWASLLMQNQFSPDKINIGALGNMVPQMHIHVICRFKNDRSWPGPIWGSKATDNPEKVQELQQIFQKQILTFKN